jgi:transposase
LKERFRTAGSADEWVEALRDNTQHDDESFEDKTVTLICGTLHGQSANKLASVVSESLKEDPQSGKGYAFCNKGLNTIAVLSWKSPVYRITKHVKVHGTFIWPHEELGTTIEVTKVEFDHLLLLEKYRKNPETISQKTSTNIDFMRVSC